MPLHEKRPDRFHSPASPESRPGQEQVQEDNRSSYSTCIRSYCKGDPRRTLTRLGTGCCDSHTV